MSTRKIADVPVTEPPSDAILTDSTQAGPQAEESAVAVKAKRKHRRRVVSPEEAPDTVIRQPAEGPKLPLSAKEIAAACRTLLLDYLTSTGGMPAAEAEAAADRAVQALSSPLAPAARDDTKLARLTSLLRRREGATLAEMVAATGWQAHSVRGALSGTLKKKMGLVVTSEVAEGGRAYRLPAEG